MQEEEMKIDPGPWSYDWHKDKKYSETCPMDVSPIADMKFCSFHGREWRLSYEVVWVAFVKWMFKIFPVLNGDQDLLCKAETIRKIQRDNGMMSAQEQET